MLLFYTVSVEAFCVLYAHVIATARRVDGDLSMRAHVHSCRMMMCVSSFVLLPLFAQHPTLASAKSIWVAMIKYLFRRVIDFPPAAVKEQNTEDNVQMTWIVLNKRYFGV